MRKTLPGALALACCLGFAARTSAAGPAPGDTAGADDAQVSTEWYGHWIFISDGASGLVLGSTALASRDKEELERAYLGVIIGSVVFAGYALGPPLVHVVHGEKLRALGSLGLRIGLPIAGGLVAEQMHQCEYEGCDDDASGIVFLVGMLAASVVDGAFLAYKQRREQQPPDDVLRFGSISASPTVTPFSHGGLTAGLQGTF